MTALSKPQLLQKIALSVQECGWNVLYLSNTHPFRLNIYKGEERYLLKIYIWNLSHGGGYKRPTDEYRIQVKVREKFQEEENVITLLLGWYDEIGVFAGFDFRKHLGLPGWSSSIQIKYEALRNSYENGFSTSDKGNGEIALAFQPDFFVDYIKNLHNLHDFGESLEDLQVLENLAQNPEINDEEIIMGNTQRKTVALTVKKKLRDNSFRKRVLTAYNHQCAVCGIQLKLVEAAHIIPVQNEGTDETSNGITLCALHHRAYDKGLITIWNDYSILLNDTQAEKLREIKLDAGLDEFSESLRHLIILPPAKLDRPHVAYLNKANEIRGWG